MRTVNILAAAALLLLAPPVAQADWSEADTRREVAYQTLLAIDWGQTLDIADKCGPNGSYKEANPILPDCPTRNEVHGYVALSAIGHYAISRALPPRHRKWWQYATISVEATAVGHNYSIGLDIKF